MGERCLKMKSLLQTNPKGIPDGSGGPRASETLRGIKLSLGMSSERVRNLNSTFPTSISHTWISENFWSLDSVFLAGKWSDRQEN